MLKAAAFVSVIVLGTFLVVPADTDGESVPFDDDESEGLLTTEEPNQTSQERQNNVDVPTSPDDSDSEGALTTMPPDSETERNNNKDKDGESASPDDGDSVEFLTTKAPKRKSTRGRNNKKNRGNKGNLNERTEVSLDHIMISRAATTDGNPTCASPPEIEGAIGPRVEGTEHEVGTTVTYSCNFGYVSRNSITHISTCKLNETAGTAEWTVPELACIPRSCGDPGYVNNARRIGNLFTFPNKVEYECDEGYKIRGLRARYCQAGGDWSGKLPICEQIYCTVPPDPLNGRVRYSSLEYGTELKYECNVGFLLKKHQHRFCAEDGSWSNDEPECAEARCEEPPSPEHGTVRLSGDPKVGSLATYSCDPGTMLIGASTTKCLITGQWTFDPPKCTNFCYVPRVENGEMGQFETRSTSRRRVTEFKKVSTGTQVNHNATLLLRCNDGFVPTDGSVIFEKNALQVTCNDGTWSKSFWCRQTSCSSEPPIIENGRAVVYTRSHGTKIWYNCVSEKYTKVKGRISCQFGEWVGYTPKCLDSPCHTSELKFPGLIKPEEELLSTMRSFDIVCENGFIKAPSAEKVTCISGKWNITQSPCIDERCYTSELHYPGLEKPSQEVFWSREHFNITCKNDFRKSPLKSIITCVEGKWDSMEDPCNRVILPETLVSNEHKVSPESSNEHTGECACTYGYAYYNVKATSKGKELQVGDTVRRGETVSFECTADNRMLLWKNGLHLFGKANMTCSKCEKWERRDLPECRFHQEGHPLIIYDDKLKILPGGAADIRKWESVRLHCFSTFRYPRWYFNGNPVRDQRSYTSHSVFNTYIDLIGTNEQHNGKYECKVESNYAYRNGSSTLDLQAIEISCPMFSVGNGLSVSYGDSNNPGSWVTFFCARNTELTGNQHSLCQNDGTWSSPQPYCQLSNIRCPPIDGNGTFSIYYGNDRRINSTAQFLCKEADKRVEGCAVATCLPNGTWSGSYPECVDYVSCPRFSSSPGLTVLYSKGVSVGSNASFTCSFLNALIGSSSAICQNDGTWNNPSPICKEITCPMFSTDNGIRVTYDNSNKRGSLATFTCSANTKLVGDTLSRCQYDGTWSKPQPYCEEPSCSIGDLSTSVPEGIVPDMTGVAGEFMPLGSEIMLACDNNLIPNGNSKAICRHNGRWELGNVQCVPGCMLVKDPSSHLLIQPVKESYRLGEFILLSCPPGEEMTGDVERLMCLGKAWSDPIPDCKEKAEESSSRGT